MSKPAIPSDLNDIFAIKPVDQLGCKIKHPGTGKEIGLEVFVRSLEHPDVKRITDAVRTKSNKMALRNKAQTAADERENSIQIITAAVVGWRWYEVEEVDPNDDKKRVMVMGNAGGQQLEYTPANVRKVLEADPIRNQVDAFLTDEAAFFQV